MKHLWRRLFLIKILWSFVETTLLRRTIWLVGWTIAQHVHEIITTLYGHWSDVKTLKKRRRNNVVTTSYAGWVFYKQGSTRRTVYIFIMYRINEIERGRERNRKSKVWIHCPSEVLAIHIENCDGELISMILTKYHWCRSPPQSQLL